MKVILLQDVAKIGRRSQIVVVPDGYAQNLLIPKKLAAPATEANLKRLKQEQAEVASVVASGDHKFTTEINKLAERPIPIKLEVNEQGHLFKSVSAQDVVTGAATLGVELDLKYVQLPQSIKESGNHTITLKQGKLEQAVVISISKK